jgi:hypothetical protein
VDKAFFVFAKMIAIGLIVALTFGFIGYATSPDGQLGATLIQRIAEVGMFGSMGVTVFGIIGAICCLGRF